MRLHSPFLLACGLLALTACGGKDEAAAPPPPEVGVIEVKPRTVPLTRDLVGRLSPYRSADVRARVPGVLLRRVYEEGSDVREGQVLFEIDPAPLQASLASASAARSVDSELATFVSASIGRPGTCEWPGRTADASVAAACRL